MPISLVLVARLSDNRSDMNMYAHERRWIDSSVADSSHANNGKVDMSSLEIWIAEKSAQFGTVFVTACVATSP